MCRGQTGVCLRTRLQQIDLGSDFGDDYKKYRGRVPMLILDVIPVGMLFVP